MVRRRASSVTGLLSTTSTAWGCAPVTSMSAPKPVSMMTGTFWLSCLMKRAVENDEIELLKPEFLECFASACGGGDRMSVATQIDRQYFAHARLIIDDEDFQFGFRSQRGLERHPGGRCAFCHRNSNDEGRSFSDGRLNF